jgi:hypothetical protein
MVAAVSALHFIAQEACMRIAPTVFLSVVFLGSAITPGWCPEPARTTSTLSGSNGRIGAAIFVNPQPKQPDTKTKSMTKSMTPSQRQDRLERSADQATKPPAKPASMSQAKWDRYQAMRSGQQKPTQFGNTAMDRLQGM